MERVKKLRGSAFPMTLPYVVRFSGWWLLVTILAVVVLTATSYWQLADRLEPDGRPWLAVDLALRALLIILAMVGLAIFTTHRLAGPLIAIRRAFEDVRDGQLDRVLVFRESDHHLRDIEASFAQMMAALRERIGAGPGAGPHR